MGGVLPRYTVVNLVHPSISQAKPFARQVIKPLNKAPRKNTIALSHGLGKSSQAGYNLAP